MVSKVEPSRRLNAVREGPVLKHWRFHPGALLPKEEDLIRESGQIARTSRLSIYINTARSVTFGE